MKEVDTIVIDRDLNNKLHELSYDWETISEVIGRLLSKPETKLSMFYDKIEKRDKNIKTDINIYIDKLLNKLEEMKKSF